MARRREALTGMLREHRADRALVYGCDRSGSAIAWLTGWPVTREAALLLRPGERDLMFVCFNNHVPNARRLAPDTDVRPGNASALDAALDVLASGPRLASRPSGPRPLGRPARPARLGVIGPVPARASDRLAAAVGQIVFLDREYTRLRLVKSAEELAWLRTAGLDVVGTAAHGSYWCHALGYSNAYFFADFPETVPGFPNVERAGEHVIAKGTLSEFGLAYEANHLGQEHYFSDARFDASGRRWHPDFLELERYEPGESVILLVHPCHWDRTVAGKTARTYTSGVRRLLSAPRRRPAPRPAPRR